MTPEQSAWFAETFNGLVANVSRAVLGADRPVRLVLTAMVAEGHVLLEDAPGTGKTSLAKAISASVQGTHQRIQFTPDLLPSDVTGVTIWDQGARTFQFHPGPCSPRCCWRTRSTAPRRRRSRRCSRSWRRGTSRSTATPTRSAARSS